MKAVVGIIVALLVLGGIYYWYSNRTPTPSTNASASATSAAQQAQTAAPAAKPNVSSLPSGSDNSDAALAQDSSAMSAQMQAFNTDTAAIDTSLNDKPLSQ